MQLLILSYKLWNAIPFAPEKQKGKVIEIQHSAQF